MDVHKPEIRSRNMRAVKSKNTALELLIRRGLHAAGFRYRLHDRLLPGTPDLTFRKFNAVIFVHGCFWHQHGCTRSKLPSNSRDFWAIKLATNANRDKRAMQQLLENGWRVATVWECALRGSHRLEGERVIQILGSWLRSVNATLDVSGDHVPQRQTNNSARATC
jgi:DNA mismatch endonuclease, patch repair protein